MIKRITGAVLAFSALLAFTACSGAIDSIDLDDTAVDTTLSETVSDGKDVSTLFQVNLDSVKIDGNTGYFENSDKDFAITIPCTLNVDADTAKEAFTIYALNYDAYTEETNSAYATKGTVSISDIIVNKKTVTLFANLYKRDGIELYIDPSVLKAKDGQALDMDGDYAQGEEEDAVSLYFYNSGLQSALPVYGLAKTHETINLTSSGFDFDEKEWSCTVDLDKKENPENVLGSSLKVQYCTLGGSWTDVSTISDSSYESSVWTYTLSWTSENVSPASYRVIATDPNNVKTTVYYAGFARRLSYDARESMREIATDDYVKEIENQASDTEFFKSIEPTYNDDGCITSLTFTINTENGSGDGSGDGVTGVSGLLDKIYLYDSSLTKKTWPSYTTIYDKESGASFNNIIKYVFSTPVSIGSEAYLYADPELAIVADGTSYCIGYDSSTILNPTAQGRVQLDYLYYYDPTISDYKYGKTLYMDSSTTTTVSFTLVEGQSVTVNFLTGNNYTTTSNGSYISSSYYSQSNKAYSRRITIQKDGSQLTSSYSGLINYTCSTEGTYTINLTNPWGNSAGYVWLQIVPGN